MTLTHITYKEKISRGARELLDTDPNQVMKYGWKNRDDKLGWVFGWELLVVGGESWIGKAQPLYSKVLTPHWFTTIWEIQVWDFVIWADGTQKKVLWIPFKWIDKIYKISLSDWTYTHASWNHLFKVLERTPWLRFKESIVCVNDMLWNIEIHNRKSKRFSLPIVMPVRFSKQKHIIPPYTLGVLLWDWCMEQNVSTIRFTNNENDIINNVKNELPENLWITIWNNWNNIYITSWHKKNTNQYNDYIHKSWLWSTHSYDKFIPKEYLYDSVENRIRLLQWLMDTDWYIQKQKERPNSSRATYTTSSKQLCDDFCFLIRSLWARPRIVSRYTQFSDSNWEKKTWRLSYTIHVNMPHDIIPVTSKKHLSKFIKWIRFSSWTMITNIEYLWEMQCKCISVEDELYITDDFIVTHNSTFINQICTNVSNQWFRVVKYSLENRLEASAKEELFYTINRIRRSTWRAPYIWWPFIANEYSSKWKWADKDYEPLLKAAFEKLSKVPIIELDKDRWVTIQDMVKLIEEEVENGTKLFIIDHLHYFVFEDSDRLDLQIKNVMHDLNELARKHNIAIIIVAHYRNTTWREKWRDMVPNPNYFRDSSSLKQVAHKIIQIVRDEDPNDSDKEVTIFYFTKFRWPIQNIKFEATFDLDVYEYNMWEATVINKVVDKEENDDPVF